MMHLEPTHRLIVGVNGASLASVPLVILLFLLLTLVSKNAPETGRTAVLPPSRAAAVPVPSVSGAGTAVSQALESPASSREAARQHQQALKPLKKAPVERVLYSVRWTAGGIRRRIAGNTPQYPAGFTGEAMVRVELVVSPKGNVRSAKLLQIGNARCDEETLREARLWKFQPLPPNQKRIDQRCAVILSFTRK